MKKRYKDRAVFASSPSGCFEMHGQHLPVGTDVVGGLGISGDWLAMTRRITKKAIDNVKCILFNGAQGDVNHVNVHPTKGDFNDMFHDFDGCSRGYGHARHIARV